MLRSIRQEIPNYPFDPEFFEQAYPVADFESFVRWWNYHWPIFASPGNFYPVSRLLDSSNRYFGIFDVNFVRSWLCLLTGPTLNDAFIDNKLFIGGLYKIEIVFG